MENPTVSLLIDTREEEKGQRRIYIKALTISGEFQAINDPGEKDLIRAKFLKRHSHLADFLNDPGAEIFSMFEGTFLNPYPGKKICGGDLSKDSTGNAL
jgi:hypothetical protein